MWEFNRDNHERLVESVSKMSNSDIVDNLEYEEPNYTSAKTGEMLNPEVIDLTKKIYTNLDLPVAGFNQGGLISGMAICKQSRAEDDARVITARMIQGNKKLRSALDKLHIPDYMSEIGGPFFEAVWDEYGDDSVARNVDFSAVFHGVSMLEAMTLLHNRVLFGIEKSTRYVDYSERRRDGNFNYIVDPLIKMVGLEEDFRRTTDKFFEIYSRVINRSGDKYKELLGWIGNNLPFENFKDKAQESLRRLGQEYATDQELREGYDKTISAALKDQVRHLLPLSARTSLGIIFNAEAMRHLVYQQQSRFFAEGIMINELFKREMKKLVGPLLDHTEYDDKRSIENRDFLFETRKPLLGYRIRDIDFKEADSIIKNEKLKLDVYRYGDFVKVNDANLNLEIMFKLDGSLDDMISAILREKVSNITITQSRNEVEHMSREQKIKLLNNYAGIGDEDLRKNRRYRPGRAFEVVSLDLTMLMPIAEIRDIRRHTVPSYLDPLNFNPEIGYYISPGLRAIGLEEDIKKANKESCGIWYKINERCGPYVASTSLPMSTFSSMNTKINLREDFHINELRTQTGAAPVYLRLCQMKYAGLSVLMPEVARLMKFVNQETEIDFGRSIQEMRSIKKRKESQEKVNIA